MRVLLNPELRFGEAYMKGDFAMESGTIADVLAIMMSRANTAKSRSLRNRRQSCVTASAD